MLPILNMDRTVNHTTEYACARKYAANSKYGSYSEPYHEVCAISKYCEVNHGTLRLLIEKEETVRWKEKKD